MRNASRLFACSLGRISEFRMSLNLSSVHNWPFQQQLAHTLTSLSNSALKNMDSETVFHVQERTKHSRCVVSRRLSVIVNESCCIEQPINSRPRSVRFPFKPVSRVHIFEVDEDANVMHYSRADYRRFLEERRQQETIAVRHVVPTEGCFLDNDAFSPSGPKSVDASPRESAESFVGRCVLFNAAA